MPIYAIVGESAQTFCNAGDEPSGAIQMSVERPYEDFYIATENGTWEIDQEHYNKEERNWRDSELHRMDIAIRIAFDRGNDTSAISQYAEELRSWPENDNFPDINYRPEYITKS